MSDVAVEVQALTKVYTSSTAPLQAVDDVDLTVTAGEIFGLIGADGAGKSTTLKILAGVLPETSGQVCIFGALPRASRRHIGFVPQSFNLYPDLTVDENLSYVGELKKVARHELERRSRHYLDLFDMTALRRRLAGHLSGGMKQKLALCAALVTAPRLLLLDEPTTGIDPVARRDFWDALVILAGQGITIVMASPHLDDAERCHRVALMDNGRIVRTNTPAAFRSALGLTRLVLRWPRLAEAESILSRAHLRDAHITDVQRCGDRLDVMCSDPAAAQRAIRRAFSDYGLDAPVPHSFTPTLENAFVSTLRDLRGPESVPEFPDTTRDIPGHEDSGTAVRADGLSKRFGSFQAVRDCHLQVRYGEVYGLVGANGAGKTTMIKMLCGLLQPSGGTVELLGRRTGLRTPAVRSQIGYMSQKFTLYDDLSIGENLDFFAGLYDLPERVRRRRQDWVLEVSGLTGKRHLRTGLLPGGWKQGLAFGAAMMHEPAVLFLDEPTSGVDPLARRVMWRVINALVDRGSAALVVTHYPEEAEQCNRLGFMAGGEILSQGSPQEVKAHERGALIEIETAAAPHASRTLRAHHAVRRVSQFGNRLHVLVDRAQDFADVLRALEAHGVPVAAARLSEPSMEDVFLSLIEERRAHEFQRPA